MNKKLIKIIGAGFASLIIISAGITAIINTVAKPAAPATEQQLDQSYDQGQQFDKAQISGTDNFTTTLSEVTDSTGKTYNNTDLAKGQLIRITAADNKLFSTVVVNGVSRAGAVKGTWISSRSMTYNGSNYLVDTYVDASTVGALEFRDTYVVVLNQTIGLLTIRNTTEVSNGNSSVVEYLAQ